MGGSATFHKHRCCWEGLAGLFLLAVLSNSENSQHGWSDDKKRSGMHGARETRLR